MSLTCCHAVSLFTWLVAAIAQAQQGKETTGSNLSYLDQAKLDKASLLQHISCTSVAVNKQVKGPQYEQGSNGVAGAWICFARFALAVIQALHRL
jgi:hypothetical protein